MTSFRIEGHRGARGRVPENTVAGFIYALSVGVDAVELDVSVSRDGTVVVYHDQILSPDITRDSDGHWLRGAGPALHTLTLAELQRYQVGAIRPHSTYRLRFPAQRRLPDATIPTLREVVMAVRERGGTALQYSIEIKANPGHPEWALPTEQLVEQVISEIRSLQLIGRSRLLSFNWRVLAIAQRIAAEIPLTFSTSQKASFDTIQAGSESAWLNGFDVSRFETLPRAVAAAGGRSWSPHHGDLNRALVEEAHRLGIDVTPWTANDPARMAQLISWGVAGIITDFPGRLREVARAAGLPLPAPVPAITVPA